MDHCDYRADPKNGSWLYEKVMSGYEILHNIFSGSFDLAPDDQTAFWQIQKLNRGSIKNVCTHKFCSPAKKQRLQYSGHP